MSAMREATHGAYNKQWLEISIWRLVYCDKGSRLNSRLLTSSFYQIEAMSSTYWLSKTLETPVHLNQQ